MTVNDSLRRQAALLFEQGYGYKAVSTQLGINRETARNWACSWRAIGTEDFCKLGGYAPRKHHTEEVKLAAVRDHLAGDSIVTVMERYNVRDRRSVTRWCRKYRDRVEDEMAREGGHRDYDC